MDIGTSILLATLILATLFNLLFLRKNQETHEVALARNTLEDILDSQNKISELELEKELEKDEVKQKILDKKKKAWDFDFFQKIEFLCYLLNNYSLSSKTLMFFKDAILTWYETVLVRHEDIMKDSTRYEEFKKFYHRAKYRPVFMGFRIPIETERKLWKIIKIGFPLLIIVATFIYIYL